MTAYTCQKSLDVLRGTWRKTVADSYTSLHLASIQFHVLSFKSKVLLRNKRISLGPGRIKNKKKKRILNLLESEYIKQQY